MSGFGNRSADGYDHGHGQAHGQSQGHGAWPVILAGGLAVAVIVITVAAVVLSRHQSGDDDGLLPDGADRSAAAVQNSPMSLPAERGAVPDACTVVRAELASSLVPHADRTNMRSPDTTDTHTDCAWSAVGGERSRQLTVELRALRPAGGKSATQKARRTFQGEQRADESGKGLPATQHVVARKVIVDLGDEAYVTYSTDKAQGLGESIINVRIVNVLVTVRYAGGDVTGEGKGRPLSKTNTMNSVTTVARQAVTTLAATQ